MKRHLTQKIISMAVIFTLITVLITTTSAAATEKPEPSDDFKQGLSKELGYVDDYSLASEGLETWKFDEITGFTSTDLDLGNFLEAAQKSINLSNNLEKPESINSRLGEKATLSNFILLKKGNEIEIHGILQYDRISTQLLSTGSYYANIETENLVKHGDVILGDLNDTENIHFVQFRIDKDYSYIYPESKRENISKSLLTIILQTYKTNRLLKFQVPIDNNIFNALYSQSKKKQWDKTGLEAKFVELYSINNNLLNKESALANTESNIEIADSTEPKNQTMTVTYNGWKGLIDELNNSPVGKASLFGYYMRNQLELTGFMTNGWTHYSSWNPGYGVSILCRPQGSGYYICQIVLYDIVTQSQSYASNKWQTALKVQVYGGFLAEYNSNTGVLELIMRNFSPNLYNVELATNGLTNQAVYISRNVNASYYQNSGGGLIKAALSVWSPTATLVSVFSYLTDSKNQAFNTADAFDESYAAQYQRYGGRVIRGIYLNSESNRLWSPGNYVLLQGIMFLTNGSSSWSNSWRCSVSGNI